MLSKESTFYLGLCPEANVPLQGRQESRGCIPDAPGETGIHLGWKQRTPLCSRIATAISWSSLGGLKGVKPPEAFGERSRDGPLGIPRGLVHWKRASSPVEAGTSGFLWFQTPIAGSLHTGDRGHVLYLKWITTRTYYITQGTLLNVIWQPGWEGSSWEKGYTYMCG